MLIKVLRAISENGLNVHFILVLSFLKQLKTIYLSF